MIFATLILQLLLSSAQARTVVLCAETWEPYTYKNSKGMITRGITHDILKKALADLGHGLLIEEVNFADRCMSLGRTGKMDGSLFTTDVGKSKTMYYLEQPLEYWTLNAMVPSDSSQNKYTSISQFDGHKIGLTKGYGYPDVIRNNKKWLIEEESEYILNMRKLSGKRIELYIDDPYQAAMVIKKENLKIRILYPAVARVPTFVEIKSPVLYRQLNKKVKELVARGYVDQIYQKYTGKSFKDFLKGPNL
ncbi:substrate-binding periplasmic protein [Bdellovibrio sp. HCB337]|uniref:substrate-binding periplasmic protein n=1 Tax=Bdellovibrio sp. HCB337 TaxID=3394358 RepID=UPI0039A6CD69